MTRAALFATGELHALAPNVLERLLRRADADSSAVRDVVTAIIARVRDGGDAALVELAREFDGVDLAALEVPRSEWDAALARVDRGVVGALQRAAANIAEVHESFAPAAAEITTRDGVRIGRRPDPLGRVGVYAPGGRSAYASSVLMGVVPARVAGVADVVVCSPPGPRGVPGDVVLAAAAIGGAHRVFSTGGAGAIAALAYGTASIPRVDRIVGPGNAFVAEAKMQVASVVGIDLPAGPSELLVLADDTADAAQVAGELLAQAEHDPLAAVVAVGMSPEWVDTLIALLGAQIAQQPRGEIIRAALAARGGALVAPCVDDAIAFANDYAAEHLLLAVADPDEWLVRLRNAGTVFLGTGSSVSFGDYLTGANHVLPTGGLARAYSGLSPLDFIRWTTYQVVDREVAARLATDTSTFAHAEGLPAHAAAARYWSTES